MKIETTRGFKFEVPDLDIDAGRHVHATGRQERRIVAALIAHLEGAGFEPLFVWDGEERVSARSAKAAMELIFNLDEAHLHVRHPNRSGTQWIYLVLGNGEDVISDYSYPTVDVSGFTTTMNLFEANVLPEVI